MNDLIARHRQLETQLDRIERKLDELLAALAEDEQEQPARTLDGESAGQARDQNQAL